MGKQLVFRPTSLVKYLLPPPQRLLWLESNGDFAHSHLSCTHESNCSQSGPVKARGNSNLKARGSSSAICSHAVSAGVSPSNRAARQRSSQDPGSTTANKGGIGKAGLEFPICSHIPGSILLFRRKEKLIIEGELAFLNYTVTKHAVNMFSDSWRTDLLSNCSKCGSIITHLAVTGTNKNPNKTIEAHNPFINSVSYSAPDGESHHGAPHKYLSLPSLIFPAGCLWDIFENSR